MNELVDSLKPYLNKKVLFNDYEYLLFVEDKEVYLQVSDGKHYSLVKVVNTELIWGTDKLIEKAMINFFKKQ